MQHLRASANLPEVVPSEWHNLPQPYRGDDAPELAPEKNELYLAIDPKGHGYEAPIPLRQPWWKRRKWAYLAVLVVVLLCAVVVRAVVGATRSKHQGSASKSDTDNSDSPTPTSTSHPFGTPTALPDSLSPSVCRGSMCSQMLATAFFKNPSTTAFLFGRGTDGAIWYREANESGWAADWMSLGGNFISPPTSVSIRDGNVNLFAVGKGGQDLQVRTFQNGVWDAAWTSLSGTCSSQPTSISYGVDKLSLLCVDANNQAQLKYYKGRWGPSVSTYQALGGWLSSTPVLDSGGSDRVDVVAYGAVEEPTGHDPVYSMIYKRYNFTSWLDWEGGWGTFKGDPAILAVSPNQTEYFGVDSNGTMWHNSWLSNGAGDQAASSLPTGYTEPENLGGNFTSAPFAFATGDLRIDVLVVGDDGGLKHKARIKGVWTEEWQDLGGYFNSAPMVFPVNIGNSSSISVFGLGDKGAVLHGVFQTDSNTPTWGAGSWFTDGGALSTDGYRLTTE